MAIKFIAEFCQNHNGDHSVLREMIHQTAEAGATVGKIQSIFASMLQFRPEFEEGLMTNGDTECIKRPYRAEYERLSRLEVNWDGHAWFKEACEKAGLIPMTTCFSRDTAKQIRALGFDHVKVASYDCASLPLLKELKELFPKLIVSTGATFDDEIHEAGRILQGMDFAMLHCVTIYPTPLDECHLARMDYLRSIAPSVGFSDHSLVERDGLAPSKIAVYAGAEWIERHVTILPRDATKDGPVSITPAQVKELVDFSKMPKEEQRRELDSRHPNWESAMGSARRTLSKPELLNRAYYRGRFASKRPESSNGRSMITNWESTPLADGS
jgi:N,N'-diacetyllegionaminate synthase